MMTGVAVVGAGHWGPHLIRNFHDHLGSEVLWVIDRDDRRLKAIGQRFRDVALSQDLGDVLEDDRVDAVVVATPTTTHHRLVKECLEAGKHVLVEKPITSDAASARELCELAAGRGLVLMVGHVFLFNPAIQAARGYIESGQLGEVFYLSMTRTNLGPVRVDVNAAWDLVSHDISIANYLLGTHPRTVSATGGSWINPGIEDAVFVTLHYPEGRAVHIHASWLSPRKSRLISVVGERQMLTVDDMDLSEPVRIYDKGVAASPPLSDTFAGFRASIREGTITIPKVTLGEPLRSECEEFLSRVAGNAATRSDGWSGLAVVLALEAIDRSLKEGGAPVEVEPL